MRSCRAVCLGWIIAAACGHEGESRPRLERAIPAVVTSLADVAVELRGADLFAGIHVSLDDHPSTVDRSWQVWIGDRPVTADWQGPTRIDIVVPSGLAAGSYDLRAVAADGRTAELADGLLVTIEPIGLRLSIEDAPDGVGRPTGGALTAGQELTAHAVIRDATDGFVANIAVDWSLTSGIGTIDAGASTSTTFVATTVGEGRITGERAAAMLSGESDIVSVAAGPATTIEIVEVPGGPGAPIGDVPDLTTDDRLDAHAVERDAHGNFVRDADPAALTWNLVNVVGTLVTGGSAVTVDFTRPGTGVLRASHAVLGSDVTGTLVVSSGRAASLAVSPASLTVSADDAPVAFTATGADADGNATLVLGTLAWAAVGPITSIDGSTGVLDPRTAGAGQVQVVSSLGPTATSGTITVTPGHAATMTVQPPSLITSADAGTTNFSVLAIDADGNDTLDLGTLSWSIAAGPITSIHPTSGSFDPVRAGTGRVRASSSWGAAAEADVTVTPGRAALLAVAPTTLDVPQGGPPVSFAATGADGEGNATSDLGTLTWSIGSGPIATIAPATGAFTPTSAGTGTVRATSSYGPSGSSGPVVVRRAATLSVALSTEPWVSIGQDFLVTLEVSNTGEAAATGVMACLPSASGSGQVVLASGPTPATATIGPGATEEFAMRYTGSSAGTVQLTGCASGIDDATGNAVSSGSASVITSVQTPPSLTAALSIPPSLTSGDPFDITMMVTNGGQATAAAVAPSALTTAGTSSAILIGAAPASQAIAGGASAVFTWRYRAGGAGTLQFAGSASGTDANSGAAVAAPPVQSNQATVVEGVVLLAADPFGDGTSFAFVTAHAGRVYLGPSADGRKAARLLPDGSALELVTFLFARDVIGNTSRNSTLAPLESIGAAGCSPNTPACGPDNEDGRGLFQAVTAGGVEWLVLGGARRGGDFDYVYMTSDTDQTLDFRYVDLSSYLEENTYGLSAMCSLPDRVYLGFPDDGGNRPYLLSLFETPSPPGLDASGSAVDDLEASEMPGFGNTSVEILDVLAGYAGRLHVASQANWMRAVVATPRTYKSHPEDWAQITPTAAVYTAKVSRTTTKLADLEPVDRAVPAMVPFGGRLFAARNTTVGPQLWSCNPTSSGDPAQCDGGDWSLVAPNSAGDAALTQFNSANHTSVTMLAATSTHLYVGFDNLVSGVSVFRTSNPAAATRADFEGLGGCSAAQHPASCQGFGGAGLGNPSQNKRIFDGKGLQVGGVDDVFLTVGSGTGPLSVYRLP